LEFSLEHLASQGKTLNIHEITRLKAGLTLLRENEGVDSVFFWGKVLGAAENFFVAFILKPGAVEFPSKKFYWSNSSFEFAELPLLADGDSTLIQTLFEDVQAPFSGSPHKPLSVGGVDSPRLTELHRLSALVRQIDAETSAVPRGSFRLDESGSVGPSFGFRGLSVTAAQELRNWVHFRPSSDVDKLRAIASDDVQFHKEFLDSVETDLPLGCWNVRTSTAADAVFLRSLLWPGYSAFHLTGTDRFGGCYVGVGERKNDLAFLL